MVSVVDRNAVFYAVLFALVCLIGAMSAVSVHAADPLWGCCVPDNPTDCFDGSINAYAGSQADFDNLCKQAMTDQSMTLATVRAEHILGRGSVSTCAPYSGAGGRCEQVCCCKDAMSPKTGEQTTREACAILGEQDPLNDPRSIKSLESGKTCDQVCSGSTGGTGGQSTYSVAGKVVQKGRTPETPVKGAVVALTFANNPAKKTTTGTDGKFTLAAVPQGTQTFVASSSSTTTPAGCRPAFAEKTIAGSVTDLKIEMDCMPASCTNAAPTISNFALDKGAGSVSFSINLNDQCGSFNNFQVSRCLKKGTAIDPSTCKYYLPTKDADFIDETVPENTELCYSVTAYFNRATPTTTKTAQTQCIITGSSECMDRAPDSPSSWCGDTPEGSVILKCDANNRLVSTECQNGKVCAQGGATASCIDAPPCNKCNGLLGFFSKLSFSIPFQGLKFTCADMASTTSGRSAASRCYKDTVTRNPTTYDERPTTLVSYNACVAVEDCSDYRSQDACTKNICETKKADGTKDSCGWKWLNEELGKGVCTSPTRPACDACTKTMGYCTRELCAAISPDCYFDAIPNGLDPETFDEPFPRCIPKSEMSCRYYDTAEQCLGASPRPAAYNPVTNERTTASDDLLHLGACSSWIVSDPVESSRCIKDSDRDADPMNEDDCIVLGLYTSDPPESYGCLKDMTPPTTTFVLRNPAVYGRHEITSLPFITGDNLSPMNEIKTYVCFDPKETASPCRPDKTFAAATVPPAGDYTMRYFSADKSGNQEIVKSASITIVESGYSTLEKIDIKQR